MRRTLFLWSVTISVSAAGPPSPKFEVASVKRNHDNRPIDIRYLPTRFAATNWPLYWLIAEAYGLTYKSARLAGGPGWSHVENYDIEARLPESVVPPGASIRKRQAILRPLLQQLLADRFHLLIRHQATRMPIYELRVAKGGLKLAKADASRRSPCRCLNGGPSHGLRGEAFEITDLVADAEFWTGRPVVDKTGLHGEFDLLTPMHWTQDDSSDPAAEPLPDFLGMYRELGLDLRSARAIIELLVIAHLDRPDQN